MTRSTLSSSAEQHIEQIASNGWTIVDNVLTPTQCQEALDDLAAIERRLGVEPSNNEFEGRRTLRAYNLIAHGGRILRDIPINTTVLPVVQGVLDPQCLISSLSSIRIMAGETAQPVHADDLLHPIQRPHSATVCNTMWALTEFTEANGATRVITGSHLANDGDFQYGSSAATTPAVMHAGSVLIWHGSLWHGGGANHTETDRVGIAMNYCAGWIRPQENQQLGVPLEIVKDAPAQLQQLLGYDVYSGLIGHIERQSPKQRLLSSEPAGIIWDQV